MEGVLRADKLSSVGVDEVREIKRGGRTRLALTPLDKHRQHGVRFRPGEAAPLMFASG